MNILPKCNTYGTPDCAQGRFRTSIEQLLYYAVGFLLLPLAPYKYPFVLNSTCVYGQSLKSFDRMRLCSWPSKCQQVICFCTTHYSIEEYAFNRQISLTFNNIKMFVLIRTDFTVIGFFESQFLSTLNYKLSVSSCNRKILRTS